jgi:hypothetical protein
LCGICPSRSLAGGASWFKDKSSVCPGTATRPILELLGIDEQTDLRMTTDGKRLIIEPVTDAERQAQFQKILKKTGKKNAEIFRRLAK